MSMELSYYPGCSLEGTAWELDNSIRAVCKALDIELTELPDWNCCGASSAHSLDDYLTIALPARNLLIAQREGKEMLVPCVACFQRLRSAQQKLEEKPDLVEDIAYDGSPDMMTFLTLVSRDEVRKKIRAGLKKRLDGLSAVCYYGCLTARPPKVTGQSNYEYPTEMDQVMADLGVECLDWPYRTDCCGASLAMGRTDILRKMTGKLLAKAKQLGADCVITGCPMCQTTLDTRQKEAEKEAGESYDLPIIYFSELLGLALECEESKSWWRKHFYNPETLLKEKELI